MVSACKPVHSPVSDAPSRKENRRKKWELVAGTFRLFVTSASPNPRETLCFCVLAVSEHWAVCDWHMSWQPRCFPSLQWGGGEGGAGGGREELHSFRMLWSPKVARQWLLVEKRRHSSSILEIQFAEFMMQLCHLVVSDGKLIMGWRTWSITVNSEGILNS